MTNNMYDTPEAGLGEATAKVEKTPLSRASGVKKLLVGSVFSGVCGFLASAGVAASITKMLAVILGAYAIIGFIEVLAGGSLIASAKKWDDLAGWKKFIISSVVIIGAVIACGLLMPIVAKYV